MHYLKQKKNYFPFFTANLSSLTTDVLAAATSREAVQQVTFVQSLMLCCLQMPRRHFHSLLASSAHLITAFVTSADFLFKPDIFQKFSSLSFYCSSSAPSHTKKSIFSQFLGSNCLKLHCFCEQMPNCSFESRPGTVLSVIPLC